MQRSVTQSVPALCIGVLCAFAPAADVQRPSVSRCSVYAHIAPLRLIVSVPPVGCSCRRLPPVAYSLTLYLKRSRRPLAFIIKVAAGSCMASQHGAAQDRLRPLRRWASVSSDIVCGPLLRRCFGTFLHVRSLHDKSVPNEVIGLALAG
jgi:hypothetical protein